MSRRHVVSSMIFVAGLIAACNTNTKRTIVDSTSVSGLAFISSQPLLATALHAGRIEQTTDGGQTWTVETAFAQLVALVGSGSALYALELSDGSASAKTEVWHSTDGGATFALTTALTAPVPATASAALTIAQTSTKTAMVALGGNPNIIETTKDGGTTWRVASVQSVSTTLYIQGVAFDASTALVAYVAHSRGVLQSTDGELTFAPLVTPFSGAVNGVAANGSSVFVATSAGLGVSKDRGATWSMTNIGKQNVVTFVALDALNAKNVYCALQGEGIFGSTDGGATFTLLHIAGKAPIVASGSTIYVGGSRSVDGGATWQNFANFDYVAVQQVY
jgi:hypothetical protein